MLPLRIALRFLKSSRGQTILIVLGIAVGVSVQVFVGSLIGSLQKTLLDRTVGNSSQVTVLPADENVTAFGGWQDMITRIRQVDSVKSVSAVADSPAFLIKDVGGDERSAQVLLRGFNFPDAEGIYKLGEALAVGTIPQQQGEVLVGKELGDKWAVKVSDVLEVQTTHGTTNVTVVGIYDLGIASLNMAWVLATMETSQMASAYGDKVTSIEMQVTDVFSADTVATQVAKAISNPAVKVTNWKELNADLLSGLQGQSISSAMIQVFVLASVAIAIASILAITVVQKSRQIGILKAMGIKDRAASTVFLLEGSILGMAGAVIGVGIGVGLLLGFQIGTASPGKPALIDLTIDPGFVAISAVIAILAAVIAALLPARKSSRLSPIEVIRNA